MEGGSERDSFVIEGPLNLGLNPHVSRSRSRANRGNAEAASTGADADADAGAGAGVGAGEAGAVRTRTAARHGAIVDLAWDPRGERLVVCWMPSSNRTEAGDRGGGVTILSTRTLPTLQAHAIGSVHVPHCDSDDGVGSFGSSSALRGVAFACAAPRSGRENGSAATGRSAIDAGVVLSVAWQNGVVGLVPLLF